MTAGQEQYCQIKAVNNIDSVYSLNVTMVTLALKADPSISFVVSLPQKVSRDLTKRTLVNGAESTQLAKFCTEIISISYHVSIPLGQVSNFNLLQL